MQIYVINLDRKPVRWQYMAGLLQGLPFKRIAAVDGKTVDGPETNIKSRPGVPFILSRYGRACTLSHRAVWGEFLAGTDRYCCVLEDDLFISPDFPKFINSEDWIPPGCDLVKLETTRQYVWFTGKSVAMLGRRGAVLSSVHLGAAAYIVSRRGAQMLLEMTLEQDRPIDFIMFHVDGLKKLHPVYQVIPAPCIQASHREDGMIFPEMESSIQPIIPPRTAKPWKPWPAKIKRETLRLVYQLNDAARRAGQRLKGVRRAIVPFA